MPLMKMLMVGTFPHGEDGLLPDNSSENENI